MKSVSPFLWRRRVGLRDVDAWGVVWYGNYLVYCDEARAELLRAYGLPPGKLRESGYIAPAVQLTSRYHAPARHDDEIDVHVRIPKAKGTRLQFEFTIRRSADNTLLAQISTTSVLIRTNGDLVYLIPEPFKEPIDAMLRSQPQAQP